MDVVGYLRVSTQQQADHGLGLDVQRSRIEEWAAVSGHSVLRWESDEGLSGSNGLETRVGLYAALEAIEQAEVQGLVVYRLDRLARDLVLQETLLSRLWTHGATVYSTDPTETETLEGGGSDPSRNLYRQILGAIAEYERALIVMRLRSGKLAKKRKGGYVGGKVPYGYDLTASGELVANEDEQRAVDEMRRLRDQGLSLRAICSALDEAGHRTKSGQPWQPASLRKVLIRES